MNESKIKVEGMACQNCAKRITLALEKIAGVKNVVVDLENKLVTVKYDDQSTLEDLKLQIEKQGYDVMQ